MRVVCRRIGPIVLGLSLSTAAVADRTSRAQRAFEEGRLYEARQLAMQVLERNPADAQILALLQHLDFIQATQQNTIVAYQRFLDTWPDGVLARRAQVQMSYLDYGSADENPGAQRWQSFLAQHTHTPLRALVLDREQTAAWESLQEVEQIEAYQSFLKLYPDSAMARSAQDRVAELEWERVVQLNSDAAYLDYLSRFPDSIRSEEAARRSEELAWTRAVSQDSVAGWRAFRAVFPDTTRG